MSRPIFTAVVACLMLLLGCAMARGQQPLGVIAIDWNYEAVDGSPRNPEAIYKKLRGAFAETLKKNLNLNDPATVADLELMREGRNIRLVIISKGAVQPTADEILAVVKNAFMETVSNLFTDIHNTELNNMRNQAMQDLDAARRRAEEAQERLTKLRKMLRDITNRVDVSPDALRAAITRLEDERDKLALDSESMKVRRKAIEETIARISERAAAEMKQDRIAVELQKLVQSRENELKRMQQLAAGNNVAAAEVDVADARVAEARVKLWERQEIVTRTAGGDLLADLNKELAMLSINTVESEARLERLAKTVNDFARAVDVIDELETALAARQAAQNAAIEAESRVAEQMRNLRQFQPPTINLHARPQP